MDYFYAQVEEKRRPMAKGKIIVVCIYSGRTEDSGVVSTVNYPGRAIGIRSGMPIATAKKIAPPADSIFIPADREYYQQISSYIDEIIRNHYNRVVQASIDEWKIEGDDKEAGQLKKDIVEATGLTCTIGIADSVLGAKMAASKAKPDGLLKLEDDRLIQESRVEKVPGIGKKTAQALNAMGVTYVKDLGKIDPPLLTENFGRKLGSSLIGLARGEYGKDIGSEKESDEVSRMGSLKVSSRDVNQIAEKISDLENDLKRYLMEIRKSYRTLTLIFITEDLKMHTKSISFSHPKPWNSDNSQEKLRLIREFLDENEKEVRRVGIRFSNFLDLGGQTTLF